MSLTEQDRNHPEVVAEIRELFHRYEAALMRNDIAALNGFFWDDPAVTRYGVCDKQLGHADLAAYRAQVPMPDFTRRLHSVRITTFGADVAVAMCEFLRSDTSLHGFQTQTWVRFPVGWRIVSAHVSMVAWPSEEPSVA